MIPEHMEPTGLKPDAEPIGDFRAVGYRKADASRGSERLLKALVRASRVPMNADARKRAEGKYGTPEERRIAARQIERLQRTVASHYGLKPELMTAARGPRDIYEKRQVAMFLARVVVRSSYPDIGKCFGGRDHTTVIHACKAVETNPELFWEAAKLRRRIRVAEEAI
jgi:chromosomal replication initiation ATPase DnaA